MRSLLRRPKNESPVPIQGRRGVRSALGVSSSMDMAGQMEVFGQVPTLFAIVDKLATNVAAVDWRLVRDGTGEPVQTHPALKVWDRPNPEYTQRAFVEAVMQHYDLTGEMWWVLDQTAGGMPVEIWPVRPDRMRPVASGRGRIVGYAHKSDVETPLRLDQVVFVRRQNPLDPYRGISPVATLAIDLEGEKAASAYNTVFFRNGAQPGGIVEIDDLMDDAEFDRMVRHWEEQHQGVSNAHRVAFIERGKYHELSYSQKDMQFTELRNFTKAQIREAYGFPKFMLGDVDDVNRATAVASETSFVRWSLNPRLDLLKEALNTQLLPLFGSSGVGVHFEYADATPSDSEEERNERGSLVDAAVKLIAAGFDPKVTMQELGLPAIPHLGAPSVA